MNPERDSLVGDPELLRDLLGGARFRQNLLHGILLAQSQGLCLR
ncbi:MAG: hypothetical protein O3A87_03435 [Verrucomicrobia bacterium]|nr:hypothetical protein [Verrucomicrobiota bacterium]